MSVACARRNASQASSPAASGSSRATSRPSRSAAPRFECTCICNHPVARVLAVASISRRRRGGQPMSMTHAPDRYTVLPDDETLTATVVALEEHGFSVEVVPDLDAARKAVLPRIPQGSVVMTNTSVTLQETRIADAIDNGGSYEPARNKMMALDVST